MSASKSHSTLRSEALRLARELREEIPDHELPRSGLLLLSIALLDLEEQFDAVLGAVQSARKIASHNAEHHTGFVWIWRILADIEDTISNPAREPLTELEQDDLEALTSAFGEVLGYLRAYRVHGDEAANDLGWAIRNFNEVAESLREDSSPAKGPAE